MPLYHEDCLLAVIGITGSPEKVRKYAFLAQRITSLLIREQELGQYSRHQADKKQFVISSLLHGETQNPEYLLRCLREFQIDPDTPKRLILIHTYPAASGRNPSVKIARSIPESSESSVSLTDPKNTTLSPEASPQPETPDSDSGIGSVLSEHQIQIFFKTAGITLHTFRYPGDYLAVADNSNFSALSAVLRNFAQKHADTLAIAVGKAVPLYQLGLSLNTAETTLRSLHQPLTDNICTENYAVFDDLTLEIILSSVSRKDRAEFFVKTIYQLSPDEKDLLRTYFSLEMSLADTAEKLFVHKNTLQYKLNHIYKKCGLIPRKFQDAVLLYLALELE